MGKAGRKILAALKEFGDALDSGIPLEERFTVRTYVIDAEPEVFDGPATRKLRDSFGMSQGVFASFLCVSTGTVRAWEQGRRVPSPLARRFLGELAAGREHFRARFSELATLKASSAKIGLPGAPINPQAARPAPKAAAERDVRTKNAPLSAGLNVASARPPKKTTAGA